MLERFGPYELLDRIAVGGMAEIFRAKRSGVRGFEKIYVVKRLHPRYSQDNDFIEMLVDEARITVQLTHPNIGQTIDLGQIDGHYYILMEFIDGRDLYRVLRRLRERGQVLPIEAAAFIAMEACQGLQYAHDKKDVDGRPLKIVHRDISPQNVVVSFEGEVKLIDFGIAKAELRAYETEAGVIKGKFYYMSPEQARGEFLDHRTDVFSLGIVLYEMVTGTLLYKDDDEITLLSQVRRAEITPPSTIRPEIPGRFEQIIMRALTRDKGDRYAHAGQMRRELERFLRSYDAGFDRVKLGKIMREMWRDERGAAADEAPDDSLAVFDDGDFTAQPEASAGFEESEPTTVEGETANSADVIYELDSGVIELEHDSLPLSESIELMDDTSAHDALQTHNQEDSSEDFFENETTKAFDRDQVMAEEAEPSVIFKDEPAPSEPARPRVIRTKQRFETHDPDEPESVDFNSQATSLLPEDELAAPHPAWQAQVQEPPRKQTQPMPDPVLGRVIENVSKNRHWYLFGLGLLMIVVLTSAVMQALLADDRPHSAELSKRKAVPLGNRRPIKAPAKAKSIPAKAQLKLISQPPGATVFYGRNGQEFSVVTPATIEVDSSTEQRLRFELKYYQTYTTALVLSPGESRELSWQLKPILGQLYVTSTPTNATVFVDGLERGQTELNLPDLRIDRVHTIRVAKDGFETTEFKFDWRSLKPPYDQRRSVVLRQKQTEPIFMQEEQTTKRRRRERNASRRRSARRRSSTRSRRTRVERQPRGFGRLNVIARPWASIFVDGRVAKRETPLVGHRVSAGRHSIKACFRGEPSNCKSKTITIEPDQKKIVKFFERD
ncbi:MAG: protein kinase domain-containing protein [Bradymonadia bacterium]